MRSLKLHNIKKRLIFGIPIMFFILLGPIPSVNFLSYEYFLHLILEIGLFLFGVLFAYLFKNRFLSFKWKRAPEKELNVEDSVLLRAMGFFQATIFIYINLPGIIFVNELYLYILKFSIPIITTLFYIFRGYGAIKNSSRHRYYSAMILIYYVVFEIGFFSNVYISTLFPIYVGSLNILPLYLPQSLSLSLFYFIDSIRNALRIRYDQSIIS